MPLFRRKIPRPPASQPRPRSSSSSAARRPATPLTGEADWRAYDPVAEDYARVMDPRMALPAQDLVGWIAPGPHWRILDVGTGTGAAARVAAATAGDGTLVAGIDASPAMARTARELGAGPTYAAAAAIDLPFRNATFDAVIANFVLSHFTRYETALFDMLRVLKRGGKLAVAAWGPEQDEFSKAWTSVAEEFAEREILSDARRRAMPWAELFADLDRLKTILHEAGLREIRAERAEYRFAMTADDYLTSREITATGRFLRQMLGEELWQRFRQRARAVFADRFPQRFNDFRDVNLAVGTKP